MSKRVGFGIAALVGALILLTVLGGRRATDGGPMAAGMVEVDGDSIDVGPIPAEIAAFLEEGRMWRAARALREYLRDGGDSSPEILLLAARAEAGWGGWRAARDYLEGAAWLDEVGDGEGWYWLARAREEDGADQEAVAAYDRFLEIRADESSERATGARLRRGLLLLRLGDRSGGAAALTTVSEQTPSLEEWMDVLSAEALGASGDTAAVRARLSGLSSEAGMRQRGRLALIRAYEVASDPSGATAAALAFAVEGGSATERATLSGAAGRIALESGDAQTARRALLAAMEAAPGSIAARDAATLLLRLPTLSTAERLAVAEIDARHGNASRAAEGFRAVLAAGGLSSAREQELRLALGRALSAAGDRAAAEAALQPLSSAAPAIAREALLLIGRSEYARGDRPAAFETFARLAQRFPGSSEGSEGLFLIADLNHDAGEVDRAADRYRQVASDFRGTDRAGLSLMRLGGIRYLSGDYQGAHAIWDEYRTSYPAGERWLEASYWAARSLEEVNDTARSNGLYRTIRERDPLSYYALGSSERLGTPYWPIPMGPAPQVDSAAVARVDEWMVAIDLLRDAGLHQEADAEAQRLADGVGNDPVLAYSLAEALNERGYAIRGIRIGQQLQQREPRMNPRLLKLLYPLPYRALVEAEARERGLDPFVVAALTRQESLFTARISSPVGARGLMQIMPETGSALANGAGIDEWDAELLFQPEINVHLGTIYLAEQMAKYDGSLPSVFSAYNAGPHRIDAWADFPEYGDEELFTERIPYRETREYVKILTRNIALYRGLYGDEDRSDPTPGP